MIFALPGFWWTKWVTRNPQSPPKAGGSENHFASFRSSALALPPRSQVHRHFAPLGSLPASSSSSDHRGIINIEGGVLSFEVGEVSMTYPPLDLSQPSFHLLFDHESSSPLPSSLRF